jgi:glycosyltransferase involved in cell wall biosynthesis|tara:strand:- start:465 stop:1673 length:1209 start_codon:yes stop_codon:yes gene_type:complete
MKLFSFIIPSRNNLKYLKQAYNSIRKNTLYPHEICIADDFSDDGTMEWVLVQMKRDKNIQFHRNHGPTRLGHTILYDTLINEYATHERVIIFHADMYLCPNADEELYKHLEPGKVVSLTRIEPPLHPDGPEKILKDFGIEPEEFEQDKLLKYLKTIDKDKKPTNGIFAPWAIMKKDFQEINGHDPLYAPQSKEDSDIFNRFKLNGYELIQTWQGFVYHMTCRGSRFKDGAMRNPAGQVFMKGRESTEWLEQNLRSTRNFIRKWGHMVKHDELMNPIIPPKYDVGFVVENCNSQMLRELEPWCSDIYGDWVGHKGIGANDYIEKEQPNTLFDLSKKIHSQHIEPTNGVVVKFDCNQLTADNFQILVNLSEIIQDSGEVGSMKLEIFELYIKSLDTYEKDLIKV